MSDKTLDEIADSIGSITEEQEDDSSKSKPAREGDEFDDEDYRRNKEDYDGGW